MKLSLLSRLCCPSCGGDLSLTPKRQVGEEVEEGELICARCDERFPVRRSIPRFVPGENYADTFGFQWNRFQRTQLDTETGRPISRQRLLRQTGWDPESLRGKSVLDVGCGAGRFVEVALSFGAEVFAVDYSDAVDACYANHRRSSGLHVLQADVYRLPLRPGSFDFVYCFGVIQHTPDPRGAFLALPPLVAPGGHLAIDVYPLRWTTVLWPKYWLRPITKRLPSRLLFSLVERMVRLLLPASRAAARIPIVGSALRKFIPVANYEGIYPLSERQLYEWAVLDTFDMLAPAYDRPQRLQAVQGWFEESRLADVWVERKGLLVGRGRKPG